MEGQVEGVDYVLAPYAIEDSELERIVYGAGDRVPMADAIKYGLVTETKSKPRTSKKAPAANRARKKSGDR